MKPDRIKCRRLVYDKRAKVWRQCATNWTVIADRIPHCARHAKDVQKDMKGAA